jgi:hypothetical protein
MREVPIMKNRRDRFKYSVLALASLLALVPLLVVSIGQAQDGDELVDDNLIFPTAEPASSDSVSQTQDWEQGFEDNLLIAVAEPADLVVTDPEADVQAIIQDTMGVAATNSVVVPAAAFAPDGSNREWFFGFNSAYLYPSGAGQYCGIAPVPLPNGVTITAMTVYVYDNEAGNLSVWLYPKQYQTTTSASAMASVALSANSTSIRALTDVTIGSTGNPVNTSKFAYHLGVCLFGTTSNLRFYSAEIFYTP